MDECLSSPCDANAICQNTIGSFTCTCNAGFTGDGLSCTGKIKNRVNDTTFTSCHFYSIRLVRYHLVRLCRDLGILGGGVPPGSLNADPILDQKMSFFIPVFKPGAPLKSIPIIRPGLSEIMSLLLRLEQQQKNIS